jgi:hypothetical protein
MQARSVLAVTIVLVIFLLTSVVYALEPFSVSPGEFTIENVPLGRIYSLEKIKNLVIRNNDNINRVFILTVQTPSEDEVREGFRPIPSDTWLKLSPSTIEVEAGNSGLVKMILDIPAQENLTNQRWEAWIQVERVPKHEFGETIAITLTVRMKIVTAEELPPPLPIKEIATILTAVAIVTISVGAWAWYKSG